MRTAIRPIGYRSHPRPGRSNGPRRRRYAWELLAENGKLLATSPPRGYASPAAAHEAVRSLKAQISLEAVDRVLDTIAETAPDGTGDQDQKPGNRNGETTQTTASPQRTQRKART